MARPSRQSHAIELTLFVWHMPQYTTESVAKHSSKPNHALVTAFISYNVTRYRNNRTFCPINIGHIHTQGGVSYMGVEPDTQGGVSYMGWSLIHKVSQTIGED